MDLLYLNVKTGEVGLKIRPSDSYETGGQRKLVVDAQTNAKEKDGLIIGIVPHPFFLGSIAAGSLPDHLTCVCRELETVHADPSDGRLG